MRESFDVAIVGAGPAGISAACVLAEKGVRTIVFERGEYPGAKNMFGGVLYGHDLAQIVPDFMDKKCPVERNIVESRIWYLSREAGFNLAYRDQAFFDQLRHNVFTVGRARFDRWFAEQARVRGALVVCSTVVTDLLKDGSGKICGVLVDRPQGELKARVVILADGINSPLAAKTGFRPEPRPEHVALAVKELIDLPEETINARFQVEAEHGITTEILGETTWGMNGVAFLYTNRSSISLGIGANLAAFSQKRIKPYEMLEEFKKHPMVAPLIQDGKPREYLAHWLAEGGYDTMPHLCGDGYVIAGDSAMMFNALHREGSNLAMASGRMAAMAVFDALNKGDVTKKGLDGYTELLRNSYVLKDLKKYRRFPSFLDSHDELFSTLPRLKCMAAREMLTVDGVTKREKQGKIWRRIRKELSVKKLLKLAWDGWRSVR